MKRIALIGMLFAFGCTKSKGDSETKPKLEPAPVAAPAAAAPAAVAQAEPAVPVLLAEGTVAPDFTVQDHNGNEIALASLKGKPVILYWYPKDETPG